jgi:hypothetical protein
MDTTTQQPLDRDAARLTKSIALAESGGGTGKPDYTVKGDKGTSTGAYQFQSRTWQNYAQQAGVDPKDMSPYNQDKVAYTMVKKWKDAGYRPEQIASMWNAGEGRPDGYINHKGYNAALGVSYDTPAYVKNVSRLYGSLMQKETGTPALQGGIPGKVEQIVGGLPQDQSLGDKLKGELNYAQQAVQEAKTGLGNVLGGNAGLGLSQIATVPLHLAGAAGGTIGDVTGAVIGAGFDATDKLLNAAGVNTQPLKDMGSDALNSVFGNSEVQKILTNLNELKQQYPELAQAGGDVFNIFTNLIPAVKSYQALKGLVSGSLAGQIAKTEAGQVVMQEAKKKGLDVFRPLSEAFDTLDKSILEKLGTREATAIPELLRLPLKDKAAELTAALTKLNKTAVATKAGYRTGLKLTKELQETLLAQQALEALAQMPAKSGLLQGLARRGINMAATGFGAKYTNPIGAVIADQASEALASRLLPPQTALLTKAILERATKQGFKKGLAGVAKSASPLAANALNTR